MIRRCLRRSTQGPLQEDVANRRKPERASINPQNQTLSGWGLAPQTPRFESSAGTMSHPGTTIRRELVMGIHRGRRTGCGIALYTN